MSTRSRIRRSIQLDVKPTVIDPFSVRVSVTLGYSCGIEHLANFLTTLANEPELLATNSIQITDSNDEKKDIQVRLSQSGVVPRKLIPERRGANEF